VTYVNIGDAKKCIPHGEGGEDKKKKSADPPLEVGELDM